MLFDGAMGTYYASRPGRAEARCESASLDAPEEIAAIHRAYLEAGCRAIRTNTFDVGTDEETARPIIKAGARIAQEAARSFGAYVFADIGPAPREGAPSPAQLYCRQAEIFLSQGLTHFIAETLPTDDGVPELARYIKERCPGTFLLVSFAAAPDGITREALSVKAARDMVPCTDGWYLMTPFRRVALITRIMAEIR